MRNLFSGYVGLKFGQISNGLGYNDDIDNFVIVDPQMAFFLVIGGNLTSDLAKRQNKSAKCGVRETQNRRLTIHRFYGIVEIRHHWLESRFVISGNL
jgi:hypothetical protein